MKKNLGSFDRTFRIVLVAGLSVAAWYWSSWILGIVAAILALEAAIGWCWLYQLLGISSAAAKPADQTAPPSFEEVAKRAVADVAADSATLMDVRTQEEWDSGHAEGALHWPLDKLERGELPDLPKDRTIYTHCMFGVRAAQAVDVLKEKGYQDVNCMGGLSDWEKAGGTMKS